MELQEYWISQGRIIERPIGEDGAVLTDRMLFARGDLLKIMVSPQGTTIKWVMFGANWTSIYFAKEWLKSFQGPFTLNFFNLGWFTEKYPDGKTANARMDHLISKSDVRFSSRVYTRDFDPNTAKLPPKLREMWLSGSADEKVVVTCTVDTVRQFTNVEFVGPESALAKVWGQETMTYPCQTGHSYDKIVSRAYYDVIKTGRPHYDHVIAAMGDPKGQVQWFGYHRLIFPTFQMEGKLPKVKVVSEVAPVDIPLL
jgi:hypothetical protein